MKQPILESMESLISRADKNKTNELHIGIELSRFKKRDLKKKRSDKRFQTSYHEVTVFFWALVVSISLFVGFDGSWCRLDYACL